MVHVRTAGRPLERLVGRTGLQPSNPTAHWLGPTGTGLMTGWLSNNHGHRATDSDLEIVKHAPSAAPMHRFVHILVKAFDVD
jgi:hypothetical protein